MRTLRTFGDPPNDIDEDDEEEDEEVSHSDDQQVIEHLSSSETEHSSASTGSQLESDGNDSAYGSDVGKPHEIEGKEKERLQRAVYLTIE